MSENGLERFLRAQEAIYESAVRELAAGEKQGHWMWFVFPQVRGLGSSPSSEFYGIASLEEAEEYCAHPVLGARLLECTALVSSHRGRSLDEIFGYPDNLKFCSSMTLFAQTEGGPGPFSEALLRFCEATRPAHSSAPGHYLHIAPRFGRVRYNGRDRACCPYQARKGVRRLFGTDWIRGANQPC